MYKELLRVSGHLEDVKEINAAYKAATMDPAPLFDEDTPEWRAWVEWEGGDTVIYYDGE